MVMVVVLLLQTRRRARTLFMAIADKIDRASDEGDREEDELDNVNRIGGADAGKRQGYDIVDQQRRTKEREMAGQGLEGSIP